MMNNVAESTGHKMGHPEFSDFFSDYCELLIATELH